MNTNQIMASLQAKYPTEKEYLQAVREVLESIEETYNRHPEFEAAKIVERIVEPDRIFTFKVTWVDDNGEIQTNTGYRVQFNSAIGPYKGGLRFHPSVNLSILKFLGFEQTFKNALTTLPMGGGKGGSDFNPKGKSDAEIMRFCQAFMLELWRNIGPDTDVPAGDIGVGGREIGFLFGMYKKLAREHTGVLTGKGMTWGGSLIRPEATGYGDVYFAENMLAMRNDGFEGKKCVISGAGNVASFAAEKLMQLGAKVLTLSDRSGTIICKDGISKDLLAKVMELKNVKRGELSEITDAGVEFVAGKNPWQLVDKYDCAFPCSRQNELLDDDAEYMVKNAGCVLVGEGANMPSTPGAIATFVGAKIMYSPGKASNAGGVATSGLEMSQNSERLSWSAEEVDSKLKGIMKSIHDNAWHHAEKYGHKGNYVMGANIAGFVKVADAMVAQGVC